MQDTALEQARAKLGAEPVPAEKAMPESLRALLESETDKWRPIIKQAGGCAD